MHGLDERRDRSEHRDEVQERREPSLKSVKEEEKDRLPNDQSRIKVFYEKKTSQKNSMPLNSARGQLK